MDRGIEFFTATCLNWQNLLDLTKHKDIVVGSLEFLSQDKRMWIYGFVIMPNHIHVLWRRQDDWLNKSVEQMFLKYTAQQIKFNLLDTKSEELRKYKSTQSDREFHFWERRPFVATMNNRIILEQKLHYIHQNPVRKNIVNLAEEYLYSSAKFYMQEENKFSFLTHYMEHL